MGLSNILPRITQITVQFFDNKMGVLKILLLIAAIPHIFCRTEFTCPFNCICDSQTGTTRCKGLDLTNLTNILIHSNTISLDLSYNQFHGVPQEIQHLTDLQYLYLQHNHIGSVTANDFEKLQHLRTIDLSSNNLMNKQSIDMKFVIPLKNLQVLDLSHNLLYTFPDFSKAKSNLQVLIVENCSINNILSNIFKGLESVRSINFSKNPIQYIQHLESKTLIKLNVSDCNIQHILPVDLRGLSVLKTLSMARNYQLKTFTSNSSSIEDLDLSDCNLNTVPTVWFSRLTKMDLQGNRITSLQVNSFGDVPDLRALILTNNAINIIEPHAFNGLSELVSLDLSFNRINEIKSNTFEQTPQLIQLLISHNYIKRITWHVASLRHLDVSHCEILQLSSGDLINMPALMTLDISHNWLSTLPNNLLANNLRKIDLSMCGIWTLNNQTFARLPKLRQLKLQGNRLSAQISKEVFHDIKEIYLGDNPWRCDCQNLVFRRLYFWLKEESRTTDYYSLLCRSPIIFEGQHWYAACGDDWDERANTSQLWIYTITSVFCLGISACILWHCLRVCAEKKKREGELVRQAERQDAHDRLQRMRRQAAENREEVDRNAPDPRDIVGPPTYDEAILLPPPVLSRSTSAISCVHSTSCAECAASTSATESTLQTATTKTRRSQHSNKRRRLRPRSAVIDISKDTTSRDQELRLKSNTTRSSIASERDKNNETTSPINVTSSADDYAESSF